MESANEHIAAALVGYTVGFTVGVVLTASIFTYLMP